METQKGFIPGQRESFHAESYRGQNDHPIYISYLRGEHGDGVGVQTGEIMQTWTKMPIISEGYASCYPLVALNGENGQMIHMSRDPWRSTNTDEYWQRLKDWQTLSCDVTLMRAERSALSDGEILKISEMFGSKFLDIDLKVDSRFGLVVDVKKRVLMVQLTDVKEMRSYNI
jgi:hypothetical protein